MTNDTDAILEDILSRWHNWMRAKPINGVDRLGESASEVPENRGGWDSASDIMDREIEAHQMSAVDFQVSGDSRGEGGMDEPYRAAIYCIARNCYTGRKVWMSPRLPQDPIERGVVLLEARNMITRRLMAAGVM